MVTTVIQSQMQQQTIQVYPQYTQQQMPLAAVPAHLRSPLYGLSIAVLTLGIICMIFGGISLGAFGYSYVSYTGVNIWVGLIVSKNVICS